MPEGSTAAATDADLARAIAAGGAASEEAELAGRFRRRVHLVALRRLRDPARAADIAQEVVARALERIRGGHLRDPGAVGAFVLGMARQMIVDDARRERRRAELLDAAAPLWELASASRDTADLDRLESCLSALPERERTVVVLTFHGGEPAPAIAAAIGTTPGNVRVLRHRAIARLRGCMEGGVRS